MRNMNNELYDKVKAYVVKGGTYIDVDVSLDHIPVFINMDDK